MALRDSLSLLRDEVAALKTAADGARAAWLTPRAPGKWTPSQVVEHVARSIEEGARDLAGQPSKFPRLPAPIQSLVRAFLFRRVLRRETFPRARTNPAMNPASGQSSPAESARRLDQVLAAFLEASGDVDRAGGVVRSSTFGRVPLADYVRFQALHVRHHRGQMPAPR
jgi:hypothetical protein